MICFHGVYRTMIRLTILIVILPAHSDIITATPFTHPPSPLSPSHTHTHTHILTHIPPPQTHTHTLSSYILTVWWRRRSLKGSTPSPVTPPLRGAVTVCGATIPYSYLYSKVRKHSNFRYIGLSYSRVVLCFYLIFSFPVLFSYHNLSHYTNFTFPHLFLFLCYHSCR